MSNHVLQSKKETFVKTRKCRMEVDMNKFPVKQEIVEKLLGKERHEQIKNVDYFYGEKIMMIMPIWGYCDYAVTKMHIHPSYLFIITFNDQLHFKFSDQTIILDPYKIFVIPPNLMHKEVISDKFTRYIAIFIDKEFFEEQIGLYTTEIEYKSNWKFIEIPSNTMNLIKEFMLEFDNKLPGWEQILQASSIKLCHGFIRNLLQIRHKDDEVIQCMEIRKAIDYMNSNLEKKITVEDLAKVANMSSSYFIRTFKQETGQSSIDYLNKIRLERVKHFLLDGEKNITEIALACGFNSSAYLSTSFAKKYGISPSEYRNMFKKE